MASFKNNASSSQRTFSKDSENKNPITSANTTTNFTTQDGRSLYQGNDMYYKRSDKVHSGNHSNNGGSKKRYDTLKGGKTGYNHNVVGVNNGMPHNLQSSNENSIQYNPVSKSKNRGYLTLKWYDYKWLKM